MFVVSYLLLACGSGFARLWGLFKVLIAPLYGLWWWQEDREASEARWYLRAVSLCEMGPSYQPERYRSLSGTDAGRSCLVASLRTCHITVCHNMSASDRLDTCY